jgi:hypothetical protein
MRGVITTRHLVLHGALVIREFGLRCYLRCWVRTLTRSAPCTFLECACR